jgi:hypothetical protein
MHACVRGGVGVRANLRSRGWVQACKQLLIACAWMVVGSHARALVRACVQTALAHRDELSLRSVFALPNVSRIGLESITCGG